jgi:hypothetical protein
MGKCLMNGGPNWEVFLFGEETRSHVSYASQEGS